MQKWEYLMAVKEFRTRWTFSDGRPQHEQEKGIEGFVDAINRLGDEGWRLVRTVENEMLFMRPKD